MNKLLFLSFLSITLLAGCGPRTTPGGPLLAKGSVNYAGKPLNAVQIGLAKPGEIALRASGVANPDGSFELRSPDGRAGDLPEGEYTLLLEAIGGEGWEFPAEFRDPLRSPIKVSFQPGQELRIEAPANSVRRTSGR